MRIVSRNLIRYGFLVGFLVPYLSASEGPEGPKQNKAQSISKIAQTKNAAILNINNFTIWARGDGQGAYPPNVQGNGSAFPRGSSHPIFADGFVWGGKCYLDAGLTQGAPTTTIRVGGSTYNVANQIGWIQGSGATGNAIDPTNLRARVYRIRRDYTTMVTDELRRDAAENNLILTSQVTDAQVADVVAQYKKDWEEWPVDIGAPYIERNGVSGFQAPPSFGTSFTVDSLISGNYDEPGIAGIAPNSPANQVVWSVMNDLNTGNMTNFAGCPPIGLEIQQTLWGYKRTDALGNLYFKRIKLINKGGAIVNAGTGAKGSFYIDSMYVCLWTDPDLGNAGDDLAGCDSSLSLGYVYNGNAVDGEYAKFNLPPPAVGYDFLAGPAVPGAATDTAVFNLKKKAGFKNLPMTSFGFFTPQFPQGAGDPPFSYEGALRWIRMMKGFVPDPSTAAPRKWPHPPGVAETFFPASGNPVTGTGFIDGQGAAYSPAPADRRFVLNTGPFRLAPSDTQEVVVGVVAGLGADRLSSVAVMKSNDAAVQTTYDLLFQVSQPPASPLVTASELDGKVIIEWGSNAARVKDTETRISQPGAYAFEGYNIYQLPSASSRLSEGKRIATYDVANSVGVVLDTQFDLVSGQFLSLPIQYGTNSGIKRYFVFDKDYVRDIAKIYNGQEYYLAVTAYSVATQPGFAASLESAPIVATVRSQKPFGITTNSSFAGTIPVTKVGQSDGTTTIRVISPTKITGDSYSVRFDSTGGTFRVINTTKNTTVLSNQTNQNADDASPIVDGIQIRVGGAPNDVKDFLHVAGTSGLINPPTYASFTFNSSGFPTQGTADRPSFDWGPVPVGTGARFGVHTAGNNADITYSGRFRPRTFRNDNFSRFIPYDFEMRFTASGGKAWMAFGSGNVVNVPFELWNTGIGTPNDTTDDFRMIPWINPEDGFDGWHLMNIDHNISGGDDDPYTSWVYWYEPYSKTPGQAGYTNEFVNRGAAYDGTDGAGHNHMEVMARTILINYNAGSVSDPTFPANVTVPLVPATGNVIRIVSTKPNTPAVVFNYSTASYVATKDVALDKTSVNRINVFPNPYYAFNAAETNRFVRFVTFNNLPQVAKVRIFNLAGQLVRTLLKGDNSQFLRWDLNNENHFPVASGIYIAHMELTLSDGSTETKILKVAIIQEQEVPDVF